MLKAEVKKKKELFDLSDSVWIARVLKAQNLCILPFFLFPQLCIFSPFYILLHRIGFQKHFYYPRRSFQFYQNIQSLKYGRQRGKEKSLGVRDPRRPQTVFFQMQNYHLFWCLGASLETQRTCLHPTGLQFGTVRLVDPKAAALLVGSLILLFTYTSRLDVGWEGLGSSVAVMDSGVFWEAEGWGSPSWCVAATQRAAAFLVVQW